MFLQSIACTTVSFKSGIVCPLCSFSFLSSFSKNTQSDEQILKDAVVSRRRE